MENIDPETYPYTASLGGSIHHGNLVTKEKEGYPVDILPKMINNDIIIYEITP
ncbi:hypothetical protein OAO42_01440 [Candidatus Izimaplasma bacterium]|nr:hypothetical protein [Candidatus Izimaplasma bacterium]